MARSVSYANNSVHVEYSYVGDSEECFDIFDYYVEQLQDALHEAFPSVYPCSKWVGREDRAIADNQFAYFGVSEYCGVVSLWVTPKEPNYRENSGWDSLRDNWISQIGKKFSKVARSSFGKPIIKVATFSNGEAVFRDASIVRG